MQHLDFSFIRNAALQKIGNWILRREAFSPDVIKHRFEFDPLQLYKFGGVLVVTKLFLLAHTDEQVRVPGPLLRDIHRDDRRSGMKELEYRMRTHTAKTTSRVEKIALAPMAHPAQIHSRIIGNLAGDSIALIHRIDGIQQASANERKELFILDGSSIGQLAVRRFANANRREGIRQFRRPQPFQQARVRKDSIDEWGIAGHADNSVRTRPLHAREFTTMLVGGQRT